MAQGPLYDDPGIDLYEQMSSNTDFNIRHSIPPQDVLTSVGGQEQFTNLEQLESFLGFRLSLCMDPIHDFYNGARSGDEPAAKSNSYDDY